MKKKGVAAENWLGHCLAVSRYNENCILTWWAGRLFGLGEGHDTIGLYCDRGGLMTEVIWVATHGVYRDGRAGPGC